MRVVVFNKNTITSAEVLLTKLDKVALSGVAYDQSEQIEGCHCVASIGRLLGGAFEQL